MSARPVSAQEIAVPAALALTAIGWRDRAHLAARRSARRARTATRATNRHSDASNDVSEAHSALRNAAES